jgi:DNA-binding response OmpR family regulator
MESLRDQSNHEPFYRDDHLFVDLRKQLALVDSQTLILTRKEYGLLAILVQHAGVVVPRGVLFGRIWGYGPGVRTRTLDVHIGRLRRKLGPAGRHIETIFKMGYSFRPSQDARPTLSNNGEEQ